MHSHPTTVLLIDAHNPNAFLQAQIERLIDRLAHFCEVVVVLHVSKVRLESVPHFLELSDEDIFTSLRHSKEGDKIVPGNPDLKIMRAIAEYPDADFFVRMESDVACVTDPIEAFEALMSKAGNADFFATQIASRRGHPSWPWWNTLQLSLAGKDPLDDLKSIKAFLPICGFSRRFAELYINALAQGCQGHYEALMPTIAKIYDLKIVDISKEGSDLIDRNSFSDRPLQLGSYRQTHFAHPIKNEDQMNLLKESIRAK